MCCVTVLYFQSMVKVWLYVSIHRHRLQTDVQDTECYIRTEVWPMLSGVTSLHTCKLHFHYMLILSLRNTLYCHSLCKMSDISHAHRCYCSDLGQRTGQKLKRSLFNNPTCHLLACIHCHIIFRRFTFVIGVPSKAAALKPWLHENRAQNWLQLKDCSFLFSIIRIVSKYEPLHQHNLQVPQNTPRYCIHCPQTWRCCLQWT